MQQSNAYTDFLSKKAEGGRHMYCDYIQGIMKWL